MSTKPVIALRVEVSHVLCMGTSMCKNVAPRAFALNEMGQSEYQGPGTATLEELKEAAYSCPMSAIKITEGEPARGAS